MPTSDCAPTIRPAHLGKRSDDDDADVIGFTARSLEAVRRGGPPGENGESD
jgi:hypothetical protein